jgi:hypothetical protein
MGKAIGWVVAWGLVLAGIWQGIESGVNGLTVVMWGVAVLIAALIVLTEEASRQVDRDLGEVERHRL